MARFFLFCYICQRTKSLNQIRIYVFNKRADFQLNLSELKQVEMGM